MCGRYGFLGTTEELSEDFPGLQVGDPVVDGYNLSPGRRLSVIFSDARALQLRNLSWGLRTDRIPKPLVNVRAEGISRHWLFRPLFLERRCLIPASHFFEWLDDSEPRQPFVCRPVNQQYCMHPKRERLDLAGIQLDGTFAILTTKSTSRLAEVHGRMPIVLGPIAAKRWLDPGMQDVGALREVVGALPEGVVQVYPVSSTVNDGRAEGRALLDPLPTTRQLRERERNSRH